MPINREVLKQLSAKPIAEPTGVAALPHTIHKIPDLREWVTLESVALPPVPVNRGGQWGLISLLAVPTQLEDGTQGWMAPWGAVEWSLPEKQVVQKIDLRSLPKTASLRQVKKISARPANSNVPLDFQSYTQRENALFSVLDPLVATPPNHQVNLAPLAPHYAGLLPVEIYPYYHTLVPESREWLLPQISPTQVNPFKSENHKRQSPAEETLIRVTYVPSLEHPTDLTDQIGSWLRKSLTLVESLPSTTQNLGELKGNLVGELQSLESRWHLPGFRLAVVGEFNRGKSTLINRLLDRLVVPVGILPTTATLTSIIAGVEDRMEVCFSKQRREVRPLEDSSWSDLLATDFAGSDKEVFAGVQITLDNSWLRSLDIELIDTPGVGDLNQRRVGLVFDVLSQCDAVIIVVNALIPFGMTETAFLQQQVMGRHIDRILVVVSHLDTVVQQERLRVINHIQQRVAEVSEKIPVLPLHALDENTTEDFVLDAVRTQIATMVFKGDRRAWRSQQVAAQIADHLDNLIKVGESAIAAARMNPVAREQALQQAKDEKRQAEFYWRKICSELERRCQQSYQKLQEKILDAKNDLVDVLSFEVSRTPNPKFWWERELPFRLRRELPAISRKSEDFAMSAIARDFESLQAEVSRTFNIQMTWKTSESLVPISQPVDTNYLPQQIELPDLQRYRLFTRIGSSAAMIGGYIFGGPIGVLTNLGIALLGEGFLNATLEKQREMISAQLPSIIDRAFDEHCQSVFKRLQHLYHQLIDDTKHQQSVWNSAKNAAVAESTLVSSTEKNWQPIITTALNLQTEIINALKQ